MVRSTDRDALQLRLEEAGIGTHVYYPVALHEHECLQPLGYEPGSLPETERATKEVLALPVCPGTSREQIEHVAETERSFYE